MGRTGWLATLVASCLLLIGGGAGLIAAAQDGAPPEDIGTVQVPDPADPPEQPQAPQAPQTSGPRDVPAPRARAALVPTELRADGVGLAAPLDPVGVRADGLMQIPDDGDRVGWYEFGPTPGAGQGSSVLAGHVDTDEGLGAMAALREVQLGALVQVGMSDGSTLTYEVVGRESIEKGELPVEELFERTGPERLTLVTCGGPWREDADSYRDNVVVVAVPVEEPSDP